MATTETERVESEDVEQILEDIGSLQWVAHTTDSDREDATHRVDTHLSLVRQHYEIATMENLGAHIEAIGVGDHARARVFIALD